MTSLEAVRLDLPVHLLRVGVRRGGRNKHRLRHLAGSAAGASDTKPDTDIGRAHSRQSLMVPRLRQCLYVSSGVLRCGRTAKHLLSTSL